MVKHDSAFASYIKDRIPNISSRLAENLAYTGRQDFICLPQYKYITTPDVIELATTLNIPVTVKDKTFIDKDTNMPFTKPQIADKGGSCVLCQKIIAMLRQDFDNMIARNNTDH